MTIQSGASGTGAFCVRIAAGSPGAGDGRFRNDLGANTGASRSGTIRFGGQTIAVAQADS